MRPPKVTLKAAITLDGRIATLGGDSKWITSPKARALAHRLRAEHDAVLVGVETVRADDPELTVRLARLPARRRPPLRVVLDSTLRTPRTSQLARVDGRARTLIIHGPRARASRRRALSALGVELAEVPLAKVPLAKGRKARGLDLDAVLAVLAIHGVRSVLVEGGSAIHGAFLESGRELRVAIFVAPKLLGAGKPFAGAPARETIAEAAELRGVRYRKVGPDMLVTGLLKSRAGLRK